MSVQQVLFGILEFLVSFFVSLILIFGSYRIVLLFTSGFDEERQLTKKNLSVGFVLGSILLGEAFIVRQAIFPVMSIIQLFVLEGNQGSSGLIRILAYGLGHILLAGLLAIVCILLSFWLFNRLTPRVDHYKEIKENNLAVAVFMAFFIIAMCFLMSQGVEGLSKALIPFPDVGGIPLE